MFATIYRAPFLLGSVFSFHHCLGSPIWLTCRTNTLYTAYFLLQHLDASVLCVHVDIYVSTLNQQLSEGRTRCPVPCAWTVSIQQVLVKHSFSMRAGCQGQPPREVGRAHSTPILTLAGILRQQKPAQPTSCSAAWFLCQTCLQLYFFIFLQSAPLYLFSIFL